MISSKNPLLVWDWKLVRIMWMSVRVKKSIKTSEDLLKWCLIAFDEILDVCSSFF